MANWQSPFLQTLESRGYLYQQTDGAGLDALALAAARGEGPTPACYIGFDATAPSLHVGSLIQIMMLRRAQQSGLKPIVLMGGGTTKLGDPSGKDEARKLLSEEEISANIAGIRQVFSRYLTFGDGPTDAIMVDNAAWLDPIRYIPFLREVGRHFSVNRMLSFDSVRLRLEREQPLSFLEFNYMILQAYDFLELSRRHGCRLQMGGSDQWGNITAGTELTRRIDQREVYGLTSPLLTTASGGKMGKTADGAVWLNADRLSPYGFWQFWRNTEDADIGRFLRLFTDLPLQEIQRLEALQGAEVNAAKIILADAVTSMAHGAEAAAEAAETARATFEGGGAGAALPSADLPAARLHEPGLPVLEALVLPALGLFASRSEARREIQGGGVRINDQVLKHDDRLLTAADLTAEGAIKISRGKKRHGLLRFT